jgi:hypothetical protein
MPLSVSRKPHSRAAERGPYHGNLGQSAVDSCLCNAEYSSALRVGNESDPGSWLRLLQDAEYNSALRGRPPGRFHQHPLVHNRDSTGWR